MEVRLRRLEQMLRARVAQFPLRDGARGTELVTSSTGPLSIDPSRGLTVLADDGLEISSASPFAIRAKLDGRTTFLRDRKIAVRSGDDSLQETKAGLVARPKLDQVRSPATDENLEELLNRLEAAFNAADAALDVRVTALESSVAAILPTPETDRASFDGLGSRIDVTSALITAGYTYEVLLSRNTLGSSPGRIYSDRAEDSATGFSVHSDDAGDDGEFTWTVIPKAAP